MASFQGELPQSQRHRRRSAQPERKVEIWGQALTVSRGVIWLGVVVVAAVMGYISFREQVSGQEATFAREMQNVASQLRNELDQGLEAVARVADSTAASFVVEPGGRTLFPFFQDFAKKILPAIHARSTLLVPVIYPSERAAFEAFVQANAEGFYGLTAENLMSEDSRLKLQKNLQSRNISEVAFTMRRDGTVTNFTVQSTAAYTAPDSLYQPGLPAYYAPWVQMYPLVSNIPVVMGDARSVPDRSFTYDRAFATKATTWSGFVVLGIDAATNMNRCSSYVVSPIMYPSASSPNATPTGFAVMSVSWDELIQPALLAGDKVKYTIVLRNVDPEIFLYQNAIINGSSVTVQADLTAYSIEVVNGTARNLGFIDATKNMDRKMAQFKQSFDVTKRPANLRVDIIPSEEYASLFLDTSGPARTAITVVLAIFGSFSVFVIFDIITRKHQQVNSELAAVELVKADVERASLQQQQVFAGMVAHEIRSPSSAIVGAIDILRETAMSEEQATLINVIEDGSKQILNLAEDLMNTNNPESAGQQAQFSQDPQLVNPKRDIVEIAWETTRLQKRYVEKVGQISMQLVVSEELPTQAHVDASRARQIISNLLGNAIKFTPNGGSVTLTADYLPIEGLLRVRVVDTGRGLSEEGLSRIFNPFQQAEENTKAVYGGTGLGLALSRDIARALGGDLFLTSEGLEKGCTATMTIRLPPPPQAVADRAVVPIRHSFRSMMSGNSPFAAAAAAAGGGAGGGAASAPADGGSSAGGGSGGPVSASTPGGLLRRRELEAAAASSAAAANGDPRSAARLPAAGGGGRQRGASIDEVRIHVLPEASHWRLLDPLGEAEPLPPRKLASAILSHLPIISHRGSQDGGYRRRSTESRRSSEDGHGHGHGYGALRRRSDHRSAAASAAAAHAYGAALRGEAPDVPWVLSGVESPVSMWTAAPAPAPPPPPPPRVLAAEDDPLVRKILRMLLTNAGFAAEVVPDGEAASAALEAGQRYDVLMLDQNMGGGEKDGLPTLLRAKRLFEEAGVAPPRIIVLSGEAADGEAAARMREAGADDVLEKPVTLQAMRDLRAQMEHQRRSRIASSHSVPQDGSSVSAAGAASPVATAMDSSGPQLRASRANVLLPPLAEQPTPPHAALAVPPGKLPPTPLSPRGTGN